MLGVLLGAVVSSGGLYQIASIDVRLVSMNAMLTVVDSMLARRQQVLEQPRDAAPSMGSGGLVSLNGRAGLRYRTYVPLVRTLPRSSMAAPIDLSPYPTEYATPNGYTYIGRRAQVLHHVQEQFGTRVTTYASHAECPTCSADVWTPDARPGIDNTALPSMNALAEYIRAHGAALGMRYVIWNQRISMGGAWQEMEDRGNVTANHKDHVHITFADNCH
jgi:hypothetical protein